MAVFKREFNSRPVTVGFPKIFVTVVPPHPVGELMLKSLKSQVNNVLL